MGGSVWRANSPSRQIKEHIDSSRRSSSLQRISDVDVCFHYSDVVVHYSELQRSSSLQRHSIEFVCKCLFNCLLNHLFGDHGCGNAPHSGFNVPARCLAHAWMFAK